MRLWLITAKQTFNIPTHLITSYVIYALCCSSSARADIKSRGVHLSFHAFSGGALYFRRGGLPPLWEVMVSTMTPPHSFKTNEVTDHSFVHLNWFSLCWNNSWSQIIFFRITTQIFCSLFEKGQRLQHNVFSSFTPSNMLRVWSTKIKEISNIFKSIIVIPDQHTNHSLCRLKCVFFPVSLHVILKVFFSKGRLLNE